MPQMRALTFDTTRESWESSTGMVLDTVPIPTLDPLDPADRTNVIIKVRYAGFCGSDRGIWSRRAFGDMILNSLAEEGRTKRVFGHEMLGEIVDVGERVGPKYGYTVGQLVSTESHIVCGACYQCRLGEYHVCARDQIIGISRDGAFADYVKLPAKALWPTDIDNIRPEVAAIQEPFGNAVHACQVTELRGKSVAVLGTGTIGLFAILIAKGLGAHRVIGVDVDPRRQAQARALGADLVLTPGASPEDRPWLADPELKAAVLDATEGVGVDVALEMAGLNSSVNNAIQMTRRGGNVVLFGVKNGEAVIQDMHRVVMNGLNLHGVVGRRLFETWQLTRGLLEQRDNGIQDAVWNTILNGGVGTMIDMKDWTRAKFEPMIDEHPKVIIRFE